MAPKLALLAAALCAVALAGCTGGGGGSGGSSDGDTTTTGGVGIGGNATIGNTTVSGGVSGNGTMGNGTGNGTADSDAPMEESVSIEGGQFVNSTVTVRVGGTVTWTHADGQQAHTVTADDGSFDSNPNCAPTVPPLPPTGDCLTNGETFTTTFSTAGSFSYRCKLTGITGTVMVVE